MNSQALPRESIGVFLCTCGGSIAKVIDLDEVAEFIRDRKKCRSVEIHDSLCEEDGLSAIRRTIKREGLECVIIGGCSPKLHEQLFREEVERVGVNPLLLEMVNLREQCAWVHANDPPSATEKAKLLVAGSVEKTGFLEGIKSLVPKTLRFKQPITRRNLLRSLFRLFREYRATATVNYQICAGVRGGCEYCMKSCPFQAVHREDLLAISEDLCRACGICSAVCPLGAIQVPIFTDEQLVAQLKGILADDGKLSPRVVVFSCDEDGYSAADAAGAEGLSYPPNVLIVRVPCIGSISEVHILKAFELGATGVLLSGCSRGSCPYINGNEVADKTCAFARELLSAFGLPPESVDVANSGGSPKDFVDSVEDFVERVSREAHRMEKIRGDTPAGPTRRESLIDLLKSFSERLGATPDLRERGKPSFAEVEIAAERCTACGVCTNKCPTGALKLLKSEDAAQISFTHARCINCGVCENVCPEGALELNSLFDLRRLVERSGETEARLKFALCAKCGEPFVSDAVIKAVFKSVKEKGAAEEQLNFIKICPDCRTKVLLTGRAG